MNPIKKVSRFLLRPLMRRISSTAKSEIEVALSKVTPRNSLYFEVHLADHCNLNCAHCDHFSPVAAPYFTDITQYEKDIKRMAVLFSGYNYTICLLGGEPLLNEKINDFLRLTREAFPISKEVSDKTTGGGGIHILTNGLLLPKMKDEFWQTCLKYKIDIEVTKYPIKFDYAKAEKIACEYGVHLSYFNDSKTVKTLYKLPLDLEGSQDPLHSFLNCHRPNHCITLEKGRLYSCSVAPHAYTIIQHFNLEIKLKEDDGIDIYKATSAKEVLEHLTHPLDFCRYCNQNKAETSLPFTISKRELSEWT